MQGRIAFCDLSRAIQPIRDDIEQAIRKVVDSSWFLRGQQTKAFEEEWAAYCGQMYCVSCNSGTDALSIAALALELRQAEVQANTLPLTAIGLERGGSRVRAVEVNNDGRLVEVSQLSVPVLLYGRLPNEAETGAALFDAAHAHGWKPPKQAVACWSFYPTKTLGGFGDAGAVTTNDGALATVMRGLIGRDDRLHDARQITSRMDEIQAAVLRVKLSRLDEWISERQRIAGLYARLLPVEVPLVSRSQTDLHHLVVIRVPKRDGLKDHLHVRGVETKVHFPTSLHKLNSAWSGPETALPRADEWCSSVLSLPCYPGLEDTELEQISSGVAEWAERVLERN